MSHAFDRKNGYPVFRMCRCEGEVPLPKRPCLPPEREECWLDKQLKSSHSDEMHKWALQSASLVSSLSPCHFLQFPGPLTSTARSKCGLFSLVIGIKIVNKKCIISFLLDDTRAQYKRTQHFSTQTLYFVSYIINRGFEE